MGDTRSTMPKGSMTDFLIDFAAGGVSGAVSKTLTAPIERVKLVIQTQDANPKIKSGEVPRYTGIGNCFTRIYNEQGMGAFWRGNGTNIIRYFPTQAFNLAFKDTIKAMFPKYNNKTDFWKFFAVQLASGGFAGAASLSIVYPLDYARTRLASDVGTGKKQFEGLMDCLKKTAAGPQGPIGLVAYPFDTVRRRLQMESERPMADRMYKGTMDCGAKILKTEGFGGMYKGALANIFRGVGASLVLVLYGEIQLALEKGGR